MHHHMMAPRKQRERIGTVQGVWFSFPFDSVQSPTCGMLPYAHSGRVFHALERPSQKHPRVFHLGPSYSYSSHTTVKIVTTPTCGHQLY